MDEVDDLMFSSEASVNRFYFYQDLNDINLFVEDEGMEYEYETIFKRLLENQYCINTIFSLGGKLKVKSRYEEFGNNTDGIKNFYIVDGDFDRYINADKMIIDNCFIYLETYNIENYFLDESACIQFAKGKLKCYDNEVKRKINFYGWKEKIVTQSKKLFLCYCFIQKYYPQIPTISRSHYEFINYKTGFEREDNSYQNYWNSILKLDEDAKNKIDNIACVYETKNGDDYFNLICGKFLFTSLCCYLRNIIDCKFDYNDLRWHLINNFDISKLKYVKDFILNS